MILFALSPETSDFLTVWGFVAGVVGCLVGIVGFAYTIYQVRKVKAAAEAAEEAAGKTLEESRTSYERFVGAFAARLLSELRGAENTKDWKVAELRAHDLAELLGTLSASRSVVRELINELRDFGQKFAKRSAGESPRFSQQKWNQLLNALHAQLDNLKAPFKEPQHGQLSADNPGGEAPRDRKDAPGEDEGETGELGPGSGGDGA